MTSPQSRQILTSETSANEYANQAPKDGNEESIDDMLANVDQFINSVYRDLSMSPPRRFSSGNALQARRLVEAESPSSSSPTAPTAGDSVLSGTTLSEGIANAASPVTRRNMTAEIDRINQICESVDQNLRSIGLFMNSSSPNSVAEEISNTNFGNSPSSSTSTMISTPLRTTNHTNKRSQRSRKTPRASLMAQLVDLSNSQTETPVELWERDHLSNINNADDDDDVILVSANIPPVVDLCTPNHNQEISRPRVQELNRRRLIHSDNVDQIDVCYAGTYSRRKRRTESSLKTSPPKSNKHLDTEKTSPAGGTPFMCPVCMESCLQHHPTSTLCGHVFCRECINRAIALTHKCPMCNKKISKKQTFRIYL